MKLAVTAVDRGLFAEAPTELLKGLLRCLGFSSLQLPFILLITTGLIAAILILIIIIFIVVVLSLAIAADVALRRRVHGLATLWVSKVFSIHII